MIIWWWFDYDLMMIWWWFLFDSVASTVENFWSHLYSSYTNTYFYHMNIIYIHNVLYIFDIYPFYNSKGCSILCSCTGEILFKPSDCVKGGIWGRNPNTWNLYSPPIDTRVGLVNGGNTSIRELGNIFSFSGKYLRHISCVKASQNRWEGVCRVI